MVDPFSRHLLDHLKTFRHNDLEWIIVSNRARGGDRERATRARDFAAGWQRAGVREKVWEQRPHRSFRKGFVSELKRAGADPDAVEFLVGHSLGLRGVYIDPEALPLRDTIDLIPPLAPEKNRRRSAARDEETRTLKLVGGQPRFEGWDPNDPRPYREITLEGSRWFRANGQPMDGRSVPGRRDGEAVASNVRQFPTGGRQNDTALGKKSRPLCSPGVHSGRPELKTVTRVSGYVSNVVEAPGSDRGGERVSDFGYLSLAATG